MKHGYPEDLEEFEKQIPLIPDEHNGALVVLKMVDAVKDLKRISELCSKISFSDEPLNRRLTSNEWDLLDKYIKLANTRTEKLTNKLENTLISIYPKESDTSPNYSHSPALFDVKILSEDLFRSHSLLYLKNGAIDNFFRSVKTRIRIKNTFTHEPGIISYLSNLAISSSILDDLIYCINHNQPTFEQRQQILNVLNKLNPTIGILHGITGEIMFNNSIFAKLADPEKPKNLLEEMRNGIRIMYNTNSIQHYYYGPNYIEDNLPADLKFWNNFIETANDFESFGKYPEFWETYKKNAIKNTAEQAGTVVFNNNSYTISDFKNILSSYPGQITERISNSVELKNTPIQCHFYLFPIVKAFGSKPASNLTKIKIVKAAIQVHNYQESTGAPLPDNLEDFPEILLSTWPDDPYTGKPLHYEKVGEQFRIYSYGRRHLPAITGEDEAVLDKPDSWVDFVFNAYSAQTD